MTVDDDPEPLPSWMLWTPTRASEWWSAPLLLVVGAGALVGVSIVARPMVPVVVAVVVGAALLLVAAVVLARVGRRAYEDPTRQAAWRLHCLRIVVAVGTVVLFALLSLAGGLPLVASIVGVGGAAVRRATRGPRLDHVVVAIGAATLLVGTVLALVVGLTVPGVPRSTAAVWVGSGFVLVPVLVVTIWLEVRDARRPAPVDVEVPPAGPVSSGG